MQKIKLSETEKEELKRIRSGFYEKFKDGNADDVKTAFDLGWVFGFIDRITE